MNNRKKIGIKIGSILLTNGKGKINQEMILTICLQIVELIRGGYDVFLVHSGAVASNLKKSRSDNLRAAIGQGLLLSNFIYLFGIHKIEVAQVLLTDDELREGNTSTTKSTILEAMNEGVITLINANDPIDSEETRKLKKCADNDELFKLVCLLLKVDMAIIGIDQLGLLSTEKKVVHHVIPSDMSKALSYVRKGNKLGHGDTGMKTKVSVCGELASKGVPIKLVSGKEKDFILRAVRGEKNFGTLFVAEK